MSNSKSPKKGARMDKEKIKRALIFLSVVVVVGGAFFWIENQRGKQNLPNEPTTEESSSTVSEFKESTIEESIDQEGIEISVAEEHDRISDFSNRLVNYESVYKRNQSIKSFLTMKCIEENTINVDPHVDIKATGEVKSVAADITDQHSYTVIAEENVNKSTNLLVVTIHFDPKVKKIDHYEINYIRNAN